MKRLFAIAAMAAVCVAASAQELKFAHVDFSELVQLMPEMDKAREVIEAASTEAQETYEAMLTEYQNKYQAYEKNANTWSATIRQTKEKELGDIQNRLQEFQQTVQQELQAQQQQLMAPIYQKAQETVNKLAKDGGYIYVFDKTSVLYVDEAKSTDLTAPARKALGIPEDRTLESLQAELQAKAQAAAGQQAQ